jgi:hypothetical protein
VFGGMVVSREVADYRRRLWQDLARNQSEGEQ